MRAIWKGTISFGLVTIPVSLYPATRREAAFLPLARAPAALHLRDAAINAAVFAPAGECKSAG